MKLSQGSFSRLRAALVFTMLVPSVMANPLANEPNNLLAFRRISSEWLNDANGFQSLEYPVFPGRISDRSSAVAVDSSGNIYVTGTSKLRADTDDDDILTIKYDPNGLQLWNARYDGDSQGYDFPAAVAVDADQNVYIAGSTNVSGQSYDFVTIKYDAQGNQLWAETYGNLYAREDYARDLFVDVAGNIYVTGMVRTASSGYDFLTIKYDAAGTQMWTAQYNGPANSTDEGRRIQVDAVGNVYVTGPSSGVGSEGDLATIKYDPNGVELWTGRVSDIYYYSQPCQLDLDGLGNVIISGIGETDGDGQAEMVTVKYNSGGQQVWMAANGEDVYFKAQTVDAQGCTYVCGNEDIWPQHRLHTYKYDPNGVILWSDSFEFQAKPDIPEAFMELDKDGHVIIAVSPGTEQSSIIKYDAQGNRIWTGVAGCDIDGSGYKGLAVDQYGNFCVIGDSFSEATNADYNIIKYAPDGQQLWYQKYQGGQLAFFPSNAIHNCQDTLYYGGSFSGNAAIVAYDTQAQRQWMSRALCRYIKAITRDSYDNLFIGGHDRTGSYPTTPFVNRYAMAKFKPDGQLQWTQHYSVPSGHNYGADIAVDLLGNSYITGDSYDSSTDYLTVKYDPNGLFCWERRFDGTDNGTDYARSVATDRQNSILVTGESEWDGTSQIFTIKYDNDGAVLWTREYPDSVQSNDAYCTSIETDSTNNAYVCGYYRAPEYSTILIKYDPNGVQQWSAVDVITGFTSGTLYDMKLTDDGYIYLAGNSYNQDNYDDILLAYDDILLAKYTEDGQLVWRKIYDHANSTGNQFRSFAVSDSGDVVIAFECIRYTEPWQNSLVVLRYNADGQMLYSDEIFFMPQNIDIIGSEIIVDAENCTHILGNFFDHENQKEQTFYIKYPAEYTCQPPLACDLDRDCLCGINDLLLFCENWLK